MKYNRCLYNIIGSTFTKIYIFKLVIRYDYLLKKVGITNVTLYN